MSIRYSRRTVSVTQQMIAEWQLGQASDNVVISIYDMTDNFMSVNQFSMTNVTGGLFKYAWTPASAHTFMIDFWNKTLDAHEYEEAKVEAA